MVNRGVFDHTDAPPLRYSAWRSLPCLASCRRLLIGAGLLAAIMAGCGPSSDKAAKQPATNAPAPQVLPGPARLRSCGPSPRRIIRPPLGERPPVEPPSRLTWLWRRREPRPDERSSRAGAYGRPAEPRFGCRASRRRTNARLAVARTGASTNAAPAASAASRIAAKVRSLQTNPAFYPALGVGVLCLCLAVVLLVRLFKSEGPEDGEAPRRRRRRPRRPGAAGQKEAERSPSIPATCSRSAPRRGSFGNSTPADGALC